MASNRNAESLVKRVRLLCCLALAVPCCPAAHAAPSQTQLSAKQLFDLADRARAAKRIEEALTLYDALSKDPDPEIRAEARFRKGMMLAAAKRYKQAALAFRALLDEKPDAARVRLELARMLVALGDEAAARRELRQAQAGGLPPSVALVVDRFASAIRSPKRFGGSLDVTLAPDSNVNRATEAKTLDTIIAPLTLSRDARSRSGLGLSLAGQSFYRVPLDTHLSVLPRVAVAANLYGAQQFDDISASALLGLEWQHERNRFSPSLGETWRWYGGKSYARTQSLTLDWLHPVGKRAQLVASGSAGRANYLTNDLQDGALYNLAMSYERAFTPQLGGSVTLIANRQTARDPGYATKSGGVSLLAWRDTGKTTLFATASLIRTEGDARLFLFTDRRREWLYRARIGATLRRFAVAGFAPVIRLTLERNASTVGIYDYHRIAGEFGITRAF